MFRWRKELQSGIYFDLVQRGFIKPEDQEPAIDGLEFYLDAFRELGTCRPGGLDLQPIPFTAIAEYSRIYRLPDFDDFAYTIRSMDNLFLRLNDELRKKGTKDAGTNPDAKNSNKR